MVVDCSINCLWKTHLKDSAVIGHSQNKGFMRGTHLANISAIKCHIFVAKGKIIGWKQKHESFVCLNLLFPIIIYINKCRIFQRKILPLQMEHPIPVLLIGFFWVFPSVYHIYMCMYIQIYTMCVMTCVDYKCVCNVS